MIEGLPSGRTISKGGYENRSKCGRKHYYASEYGGVGLETSRADIEMAIGAATHKGPEILLLGGGVEGAVTVCLKEWEQQEKGFQTDNNPLLSSQIEEGKAITEAFTRGWHKYRLPQLLEDYDIISVEEERHTPLSDVVSLYSRADFVAREKASGNIIVFNNKTAQDWDLSDWLFDIQMFTEALAEEWHLKQPVAGCMVEGFVKGRRSAGFLGSRLIYAYQMKDGTLRQGTYTGGKKVFIPNIMPLSEWIEQLEPDTIANAFKRTPLIPKRERVVERWLKTVVRRETDLFLLLTDPSITEEDRLEYFEQNFSKFNCRGCPFYDACFDLADIEGMVVSGRLRLRGTRRTGNVVPSQDGENLP